MYWLRPKGEPIAQGFTPIKSGSVYRATLPVPDTISAFALVFEKDKLKDNNQDKTYAFLLYTSDGKPKPGSYASLSKLYSANFYYVGSQEQDTKTALQFIQQEIALNPSAKRQYLTDYLYALNPGDTTDRQTLQAELKTYAALTNLSQQEMESLAYFYQQLGEQGLAETMTKRNEAKFGKLFDWNKAYDHFRGPLTLAQKKASYDTLKQASAKATDPYVSQYIRYSYSTYLKTLADSTQWAAFETLIQSAPADYKPNTMGAYNAIAWDWAEKGKNLEKAAELAKLGTAWAKAHIKAPREAIDPVYETDKQLEKSRLRAYGTYADTYGYILLKQGKVKEAIPYLSEAAAAKDGENTEINERYIQALGQVDPAAVLKQVPPLITQNKSSKPIEDAFKTAYRQTHPGSWGFEAYLAGLKQQALEKQKADLRAKLIRRPAPAFSLLNLDGKTVRLADLKGKTVVVDFWATWCGPCVKSFPGMQKAVEHYKADPTVAFVFVNAWQTEADKKKNAADFIAKKSYPFNVLLDEKNEVIAAYGVAGIPTKFVIDKAGVIRFKTVGSSAGAEAVADEISMMIELANEPAN